MKHCAEVIPFFVQFTACVFCFWHNEVTARLLWEPVHPFVCRTAVYSRRSCDRPSRHALSHAALPNLNSSKLNPLLWRFPNCLYKFCNLQIRVRFPSVKDVSLLHSVQTDCGVHPACYPMGIVGCFPRDKAAGGWSWPLTSTSAEVKDTWTYTSTPPYVFMA
jgi:hypothetical protein